MEILRHGTVQERKVVLANMKTPLFKTLINIIDNVLENPDYQDDIIKPELLSLYSSTYEKLLDKDVKLKNKMAILQKSGYEYLPIFLEIVGEDIDEFLPSEVNRTLKDCPIPNCKSKRLKRLPNHLNNVHKIKDRKQWIKRAKSSSGNSDDDDDDDDDDDVNIKTR